ncbi:sensor histidine kinase [Agaribacterium haliotis]|uniref:sensor histidine kinase n=1 Tax=Agaribacterium haliotis TaxID=2013869 RepID=UPI000BB57090|nr:ATP-binding protein [Agaribacterium haliotis]
MNVSLTLRFRCLFLLQLLVLFILLFTCVFVLKLEQQPLTSVLFVGLAVLQLLLLLSFVERHFRLVAQFFRAAQSGDFSQSLGDGAYSNELKQSFNQLNRQLAEKRHQKEAENDFLRALVRQAPVAILAFDQLGNISLFNLAASRLFNQASPVNIRELEHSFSGFVDALNKNTGQSRALCKVVRDGVEYNLMLAQSSAVLDDKQQSLVTIENIGRELMDAEYQAWRNLISVLTHEVMNSVTPVVSLATTCRDILSQDELLSMPPEQLNAELHDAKQAVRTIASRSEGIVSFVQAYRQLAKMPAPEFESINMVDFFAEQKPLYMNLGASERLELSIDIEPASLALRADRQQLAQVLLNLVKNAIEAMETSAEAKLNIELRLRAAKTVLSVKDTGCGIEASMLEQIFVPFFTTKRHGSGVGLALTRQFMHAHAGQLAVHSNVGEGTRIELIFN